MLVQVQGKQRGLTLHGADAVAFFVQGVVGALIRNAAAQKANAKVMSAVTDAERIVPRLRAAGLLLLLLVSLPFSLIGMLIMMVSYGIRSLLSNKTPPATPGPQRKTAIVTGQASSPEAEDSELQTDPCMTGQDMGIPCCIPSCL